MTAEEHEALQNLPSTLVALEESIAELADDLGGEEFRDMPEVKGQWMFLNTINTTACSNYLSHMLCRLACKAIAASPSSKRKPLRS